MLSGEQRQIQEVFAPLAKNAPGAFALRDDAAVLEAAADVDLVITTDTVVEGVHFFADDPADLIARKVLRVNLSDLAAKGAEPGGYLVSLATPPRCDRAWIELFADGLAADQAAYGCYLIGGDTVRTEGPITISITATGTVQKQKIKRRSGARVGELIYVTGTIGDAFLGLKMRNDGTMADAAGDEHFRFLCDRYLVPQPRVDFVPAVRAFASAAMDVSDGLAGDLAALCSASEVSAQVDLTQVALSDAARSVLGKGLISLPELMSGGDDYELVMSVPPNSVYSLESAARRLSARVSRIGRIISGDTPLEFFGEGGAPVEFERTSYSHLD